MPAQVVVVKRSRRRAFEILRAVPAWLRALFSALGAQRARRRAAQRVDVDARAEGPGSAGLELRSGVLSPVLVAGTDLSRCAECGRCVAACPTNALAMRVDDEPDLVLDPGRCIGCGDCVRACPEKWLELGIAARRVGYGSSPSRQSLGAGRGFSVEAAIAGPGSR